MQQEFKNEIIADEKYINDQIFWNYVKYQNPLFLVNDLIRVKKYKIMKLVNNVNDGMNDLINATIRKEIPENENPKKVVNIVEKIFDFNKQQKAKGI